MLYPFFFEELILDMLGNWFVDSGRATLKQAMKQWMYEERTQGRKLGLCSEVRMK